MYQHALCKVSLLALCAAHDPSASLITPPVFSSVIADRHACMHAPDGKWHVQSKTSSRIERRVALLACSW